jgi:hypothetical protein
VFVARQFSLPAAIILYIAILVMASLEFELLLEAGAESLLQALQLFEFHIDRVEARIVGAFVAEITDHDLINNLPSSPVSTCAFGVYAFIDYCRAA